MTFKFSAYHLISYLKNKYVIIFITGAFCITSLLFFKEYLTNKVTQEWDIIQKEKDNKLSSEILKDIKIFQEDIYHKSETIIGNNDFKIIMKNYSGHGLDKEKFFTLLKKHSLNENYEILDTLSNTLCWVGRRNHITKKLNFSFTDNDTSFISSGAIYSYYIYVSKIKINNKVSGYIVNNKIISTNYNLNNRYLKSAGLETELQNKYNIPIKFYFNKKPLPKKGFIIRSISDIKGNQIGYIELSGMQKESYLEKISNTSNAVIYTLIIILFLLLSFSIRRFYFSQPGIIQILAFSLHIWLLRFILIGSNYFNLIPLTGLFSRQYYFSEFGGGAFSSLGDATISVVFICINLIYILYVILKCLPKFENASINKHPTLSVFIFFIINIFLLLLIRAFGASLRSLVFDSTFKLYDFRSLLPSAQVTLIYINLSIISISIIILGVILFLPQILIFKNKSGKILRFIFILVPIAFSLLVYNYYDKSVQVNIAGQIIIITISLSISFILVKRNNSGKNILNFQICFIIFLFALITGFYFFNEKIEFKQKADIERKGEELIRPVDDYITYLMNKLMSQLSIDESLPTLLHSFDELQNYDEAFIRWLNSPLSQEKYNSAYIIFDNSGNIVSQFSVGILDNDLRAFARDVRKIDQSLINLYQVGNSSLKHYIGIEPVFLGKEKVGTIVIIIASDENIFLRNGAPDYLRSYSTDDKYSEMQNIIVSEFINSQLISSTNTIYSKEQVLPQWISNHLFNNNQPSKGIWVNENINEKDFQSFYISANSKEPIEHIYSLSIENLDLRWHLYNFFKVILVNTVLMLIISILYVIYRLVFNKKIFLNFRTRMLLALLSISIIPVVTLWFYTETYIENQNQRTLVRNLSNDVDIISNNLLKHFGGVIDSTSLLGNLTLNDARNIADNCGRDFNLYFGDVLIISSRPEMYKTELVSRYVSADAYSQLYISGKNFYYEDANIGNYPYLVGYVPITGSSGKALGVLSVPVMYKDSLTEFDLAQSLAFIFGGYILVFFMIIIFGYYLSNIISTPIRNLTNATKNIISGDLESKIPVTGKDEISELISSFNKMTEELKNSQKELAKAERENAWKEMAKQVAHEIKNPLTPMRLSVQHLQRMEKDKAENFNEVFDRVTKTLVEQIDTLSKIVSGFSHFAKMPERHIGKCDIHEIITQAINLFKEEKAVDFEANFCDNNKTIEGDPEELRRVFINIIRNSFQAIHSKGNSNGKIFIRTELTGKQMLITVNDNGIGIPQDILTKVFDVNFSTKKDGMGIGLKISRKTIRDFGGDIRISSIENEGTTVEITL